MQFRSGNGFLINRLVMWNSSGTAFTLFLNGAGDDIRGQFPNNVAGSSSSIGTEFTDNQFRVFSSGDETKEIAFSAGDITTSNTRTITMADHDVDLTPLDDSGNIDTTGTVTATGYSTNAADGQRKLLFPENASLTPAAGEEAIYHQGGVIYKA